MTIGRATGILGAGAVVFVLLFAWQRSRSTFLRIEAEAPLAHGIATRTGMRPAEVMALREILGVELPPERLEAECRRFRALDAELGAGLAVVALMGHEAEARAALSRAGSDPARAWEDFRSRPEAFSGARFRANAERFARREAAGR